LFYFLNAEEKIWASWNFLPKNLSLSSKNMGLGSGNRDPGKKPIPDPGSKRHRITDPDPQHCLLYYISPSRSLEETDKKKTVHDEGKALFGVRQ
jgi:hypothetical protein